MRTHNCFIGQSPYDPSLLIKRILAESNTVRGGIEFLILDDGSTDKTLEVVREFGHRGGAIIIPLLSGTGPIHLLNMGIGYATAPLVAFFDADDMIECDYFRELAAPFAWDGCAYSYCDNFETTEGQLGTTVRHLSGNPFLGTGIGGFMFRKAALEEVGGFDESLLTPVAYAFPEFDLLFKIALTGRGSSHIPKPLWTYARRHGSMSRELRGHRMERGKEILRKRYGSLPQMREF